MSEREERLERALQRIAEWVDAYPLDVFPAADKEYLEKAAWALKEHEMTLDRIAAHCMRHVITRVGAIARDALAEE